MTRVATAFSQVRLVMLSLASLAMLCGTAVGATVLWQDRFGPGIELNNAVDVVVAGPDVYLAGNLPALACPGTNLGCGAFVRRYDSSGNQLWTTHDFGAGYFRALALAAHTSGIYVAGRGGVSSQLWLERLSRSGVPEWASVNGPGDATALEVDDSGVYAAGITYGAFSGESYAGNQDGFARRYDHLGNVVWTREFGTAGQDRVSGAALYGSSFYVAGFAGGALPGQTFYGGGFDAFVRKYDLDGNVTWTRQFGGDGFDQVADVAVDSSGVYLLGDSYSPLPGQTNPGTWLRKYSLDGTELWTRVFPPAAVSSAGGLRLDDAGIYAVGSVKGLPDGQSPQFNFSAFVKMYDRDGNERCTFIVPGSSDSTGAESFGYRAAGVGSALYVAGSIFDPILYFQAWIAKVDLSVPIASATAESPVNEGSLVTLDGSSSNGGCNAGPLTYSWSLSTSSGPPVTLSSTTAAKPTFRALDNGTYVFSLTVSSGGRSSTTEVGVVVENVAPTVEITAPVTGSLYPVNAPVVFDGRFTDPGVQDTHTAQWMLDGLAVPGTVTELGGSGTTRASYTFNAAGVYRVSLFVTDKDGATGSASTVGDLEDLVVVFDPSAGFVTGSGWIISPPGAYVPSPDLTGKATFGFVSKYRKGATVPSGETEFQFKAAGLNFHSTAFEWMVVAGARAQYKGNGTINGAGDYAFVLTAIDGGLAGGKQDKFRIRIWDRVGGGLIYDNQSGASDADEPTTVISGGDIVIHR